MNSHLETEMPANAFFKLQGQLPKLRGELQAPESSFTADSAPRRVFGSKRPERYVFFDTKRPCGGPRHPLRSENKGAECTRKGKGQRGFSCIRGSLVEIFGPEKLYLNIERVLGKVEPK